MEKQIYRFGPQTDGSAEMADLLGGKGANLAEMTNLGMPVPFGITVPTSVCQDYRDEGESSKMQFIEALVHKHVLPALEDIENHIGYSPLWSVRSGAKFSMPGMMDTLLNIGLNDENFEEWSERLGELAALDCRRRQIQMYGTTVADIPNEAFTKAWNYLMTCKYSLKAAPKNDSEMLKSKKHMQRAKKNFEIAYNAHTNNEFPSSVRGQLVGSIKAVFDSWDSERAVEYRAMHGIDDSLGTAVSIQMMVYGNMNHESASGVEFTRDPATGEDEVMGEFLINAQGEDVVAGTATPMPIEKMAAWNPKVAHELKCIGMDLEKHYHDMMDLEFTVEDGKLWMLQCRVGKRSAKAAFRIAHDMVEEGLISKEDAVSRVNAKQYMAMKKVRVEGTVPKHDYDGIAAGGGLVVGHVVTTSAQAKNEGKDKPVILVTDETTPEDFGGMAASVGILTRTGGKTCHAAVVGRSLEKHCVVGCTDLLDLTGFPGQITIDGSSGRVWLTGLPLSKGKIDKYAGLILEWAIDDNSDIVIKTTHEDELLNGRYITTDGTDAVQFAAFLQKANADNSITECYIDLTLAGENQLAVDKDLWNLVGDCAPVDQQTILQDRMAALLSTPKAFPLKGIAVLVPSVYSDIHEINQLRKSGWKVVSRIKTIAELLSSDGIVDIDEGFAKDIGGESVANKLFKIMEDAGKPVRRKPKAVSQNRLVFDVLK